MMDRLDNCAWLRQELADGGLRQMISEIDSADDVDMDKNDYKKNYNGRRRNAKKNTKLGGEYHPSKRDIALEMAKRTNPKFAKFIDRLLVTSGVLLVNHKSSSSVSMQDIENILQFNDDMGLENELILAPLQKHRSSSQTNDELKNVMESSTLGEESDVEENNSVASCSSSTSGSDDSSHSLDHH